MHMISGAIEKHMREPHNITLTSQIIENYISIIKRCPDRLRLVIAEALLTKERAPTINLQDKSFAKTFLIF